MRTTRTCRSSRLISWLLLFSLMLGLFPALQPAASAASWADEYLNKLVSWGVMRGDQAGNLDPDRDITRAEFLSMINRAYGYTEPARTPFTDVSPAAWYADDIGIAYKAGYFTGTSANTAAPDDTLTREQATVILGRNLMLQEGAGESLDFTDSRELSNWSRGLVKTAAEYGVVKGLPDGTFQPQRNITRGEVASLLVNAIGTPVNASGEYSLGSIYGNVTISASGVTLRNTVIAGDLYLTGGVGLGYVTLENVTVLGKIIASGAGEANKGDSSIILRNVTSQEMVVDSPANQYVTIRSEGDTLIEKTSVRTPSYLEDVTGTGMGLKYIELNGESGTTLELSGNIKEVVNLTPGSTVNLALGSAQTLTVDEAASGSKLNIAGGAEIKTLNLDTGASVTGDGDVETLNVNSNGSTVSMLPDNIVIRPGVNANVNGTVMDSATGAESSQEPKLLSGYPRAADVAPTSANALFSTNKSGTIYWAVSSITDGSVSESDLIAPPSYGSKILKNGSVNATSASSELTAKITGLTSDGSYYLSAVLVDSRDQRSPVKVVAFTTPDDSVPNFATGYPVMTKITKADPQVTVMTTKSCKLYYALLPKGATAPTPADFKSSAVTGNLGFGVVDVTKNSTLPITVNDKLLEELETYDLYLWLNDADNAKSSAVKKLTFTTADTTPPTYVTEPYMTTQKETSVGFTASLNEAGTLYWAVVKLGTEYPKPLAGNTGNTGKVPLDSEVAKLQVASGLNAFKSGRVSMSEGKDATFNVTGLATETAYVLYYVAQDKAGNYTAAVQTLPFNTLDANAPTASIEFTKYNGNETGTPLADTDIRIVFNERVQTFPEAVILDELYTAVTSATSESARITARDTMAVALESVFTFYDLSAGDETLATIRNSANNGSVGDSWLIDYRYARITQEDGQTVVTLPTIPASNGAESALNLRSGSTYRFDVKGLSDASRNTIGTFSLPDKKGFTTVFAQVNLKVTNSYIIPNPDHSDSSDPSVPEEITLHMGFTATPVSTNKVDDTIFWDMLLWSDTSLQFDLYGRTLSSTNADWEKLGSSEITVASGDSPFVGTSLMRNVLGQRQFDQLNSLTTDYEYGIRVTRLDGNSIENTWNASINMMVGVAAGSNNTLDDLSRTLTRPSWTAALASRDVTSIGNCVQQGSDEATLKRVFSDSVAPTFASGFPTFDATDSGLTMRVMLDRPGTVFYVVAPLGDVSTTLPDGKKVDEQNLANYQTLPDLTTVNHGLTPIELSAPDYLNIVSDKLSGSNPDIRWGRKDGVSVSSVSIPVSDLMADTNYVVYFVLVGSSSSVYSKVLGARFTTPRITRPILTLELSNPSVKAQSDRQASVDYILMTDNQAQFPEVLLETLFDSTAANGGNNWSPDAPDGYSGLYGNFTVWEALCEDVTKDGISTGSVFDWCASTGLKNKVADLIRNRQTGGTIIHKNSTILQGGASEYINFSDIMTAGTSYFFLAVGKVPPPQNSSDAFRAIRPVEKLDNEPPVITSCTSSLAQTGTGAYAGTLTIGFSEGIYYVERSNPSKPGTYTPIEAIPGPDASDSSYRSLVSVITAAPLSYTIRTNAPGTAMTAVQFQFSAIYEGESFIFSPNLGDSFGNTHEKATLTLTLKVDPNTNQASFVISPSVWDRTQ